MTKRVVIVGAGIGGMATANLLARAGCVVDVYEQRSQLGGRAGSMNIDGFRFDTGPSWYLMPEVFDHYYQLLGTSANDQLDLVQLSPAYKVFFERDEPIVITSDVETDAGTFESIEPGAGQKLTRYVERGQLIYDLAIKHFLYTNFQTLREFMTRDHIRHLPLLTRLLTTPIDKYVSRYVREPRLQKILEYPMVFLGTSPFAAPAMYSLMSALDFREGVFYPRGGMYEIIESLEDIGSQLGVTYHLDAPVTSINTTAGQASGVTLADGTQRDADIVISNADLHFTETALLAPEYRTYPEDYWQKRDPGLSALLLYIGVRGELPELQHHNLYFVDDWKTNFDAIYNDHTVPDQASLYVSKTSATDDDAAPDGHENLFVLMPLPTGVDLSDEQTATLTDAIIERLATMSGAHDLADRIVTLRHFQPQDFGNEFNSWQSTALGASHILRQSAMFRTPNRSKKISNLYYVGANTVPGIGLPMCLIGAELVYKRIIGEKRAGRVTNIQRDDR